jgi:hypothetical protein
LTFLNRSNWPAWGAALVYLTVTGLLVIGTLPQTGGQLVYPLDDTYIHMAMAKNLVQHGVWGVTEYGFTSSTSSPLWTGLLALAYLLTGVHSATPLILNLFLGLALVFSLDVQVRNSFPSGGARLGLLLFLSFAIPLPTLTFLGMEHVLHILLSVWFLALAAESLASQTSPRALWLLAFLLPIARYESLFLIGIASVLFALRGRWGMAISLLAAAGLSVTGYGLWSVANSWYFLPNSVLVKANTFVFSQDALSSTFYFLAFNLSSAPVLLALMLVIGLVALSLPRGLWDERRVWAFIVLPTALAQILLARTGWLYRYEAYLIALGLLTVLRGLAGRVNLESLRRADASRSTRLAVALTAALLLFLLGQRSVLAFRDTAQTAVGISRQQIQMARFIQRYYPQATVAINDIGAIAFETDAHIVDLVGLATMDAARARLDGSMSTQTIRTLSRGARIAIVYENWYTMFGGLPPEWIKAGEWNFGKSAMLGSKVSFFAVDPSEAERLRAALTEYPHP